MKLISLAAILFGLAASWVPGQVNLRNTQWDAVTVEVRLGSAQDCALNLSAGQRTLKKGQTWAVQSDAAVLLATRIRARGGRRAVGALAPAYRGGRKRRGSRAVKCAPPERLTLVVS